MKVVINTIGRTLFRSKWYLFLLAAFVSVVLGTIGYFYYSHSVKQLRSEKENELKAIAELKINQLVQWHRERIADAKVVSESPFFVTGIEEWLNNKISKPLKVDILERLHSAKTNFGYEDIFLISTRGDILLSNIQSQLKCETIILPKIFEASRNGKITFTDFYYCDTHKKIHYDIIAPIKNENNSIIADLIFRVDPNEYLYPLIQTWSTPSKTAETYIVRKEGNYAVILNKLRHSTEPALSHRVPVTKNEKAAAQSALGYVGIHEGKDYRGVDVLAYRSHVSGTDWYMVSKIDKDEIFADIYFRGAIVSILIVLLIISLTIGIVWIYHYRQRNIYKNLWQIQEEFRITLDSIGDAVISTDLHGRIKYMNEIAEKLTGWNEEEAIGLDSIDVFKIINEETRAAVENPAEKVLREGVICGLANHTLLISKDGTERPITDSGAPINNEEGEIVGVVLVFRDQTEERLQQNILKARLTLFEFAPSHSLNEILTKTLDEVEILTKSEIGFYHFIMPDQETLQLQAWSTKTEKEFCKAEGKGLHYKVSEAGVWTDCIHQKKPVVHNNYASLPNKKGMPEGHALVTRELVVPILRNDKIVAIIGVGNKPTDYTDKDVEIVSFIADVAWEIAQEKLKEEKIAEGDRKFYSMINNLNGSVYRCANDPDWTMEFMSNSIFTLSGYPSSDFTNNNIRTFDSIIHPEDKQRVRNEIQTAIEQKTPYTLEYRIISASGNVKWVWERGHGVFEEDKLIALEGYVSDITGRKQAEIALRESEEKFRSLFNEGLTGNFVSTIDGKMLLCNRAYAEIMGFDSVEEMLNTSTKTFYKNLEDRNEIIRLIKENGKLINYEYQLIRRDKKEITVIANISGEFDETGKLILLKGYIFDITERKQAEEKLLDSEQKLKSIFENSTNLFYSHGIDHVLHYLSPQVKTILGYEIEDALIKWTELASDNLINEIGIQKTVKAIETGETQEPYELELVHKNGTKVWVEVREAPVVENGKTIAIVGSLNDITGRKKAEEELQRSQNRLLEFFEDDISAYFLSTPNGKLLFCNSTFIRLFGFKSKEEALEYPIEKLYSNSSARKRLLTLLKEKKKIENLEDEYITKDGKIISAIVNAAGEFDKAGELIQIKGYIIDVTERKKAEEGVRKLSLAIEQSPVSVIITDTNGDIEYVNEKFSKVTGYTRNEVIGKNPRFLKSGHHDKKFYEELWETILSGKEWSGEILNKKKNGELFWESEVISPLVNVNGDITHFVAIKEDITEKKKMVEELIASKEEAIASEKMKAEFLAQMSHEIRTPLNIILSNASLIKDEMNQSSLTEDILSSFDSIASASKRIIRTIELILDMSEIQTGSFRLNKKNIDINTQIIEPLISGHKKFAEIKGIELIYNCDVHTSKLYCDEYCVTQIFANLIDNAIKYTIKGSVEVSLFKNEKSKLVFEIKDTGIGISKNYTENIFKPFVQEEQGYTRSFEGNGLGLALVKRYCELSNAIIEVESEKGVGSTFRVVFN